jgi:choline dehydrogenase-like flavoprotein
MNQDIRADYCIAGAGPAGIVLASKLAASGKQVVIVDQGPRFTEADRSNMLRRSTETLNDFADYNDAVGAATVAPHSSASPAGQVVDWPAQRLFGIGGTALHFEGIMGRPREDDLRVRSLYGYGRDWPLTYAELEPWLLRAEQEVGTAGADDNPYASPRSGPFPMPAHPFSYFDREIFAPALERLGVTGHSCARAVASQPYRGRSPCLACRACKFCPSGARYSPDRVHIPRLEQRPNVTILPNVSIRRLETDATGERIAAAHAMHVEERTPLVVRAEHFVVALGGVETPRLLLLSAGNAAHSEGLGNMGGQLGRRFSDHLHPWVTLDVGRPVGGRLGFETMSTDHFRARRDRSERPTFWILASPAMDWFPVGIEAAAWSTHDGILSMDAVRESIPRMATFTGMMELSGNGVLELDESARDSFGSPIAKVTMTLSDWDRRSVEDMAALASRTADAMGATNASEISPPDSGLGYHPSGATAMAESADAGVCDPNLKVFGLDNLHLVSNSVFPHMAANPPTLTIIALALRLAAHFEGSEVL